MGPVLRPASTNWRRASSNGLPRAIANVEHAKDDDVVRVLFVRERGIRATDDGVDILLPEPRRGWLNLIQRPGQLSEIHHATLASIASPESWIASREIEVTAGGAVAEDLGSEVVRARSSIRADGYERACGWGAGR